MDYKLLIAHIEQNTTFEFETLKSDGSNADRFFCADVVGAKRFAQNYGGYPRSEIAEINEAANLEQQMNILQSLNDYTPSTNPNAGLSDAEIMLGHKSKYLQAASEQIGWLENQIAQRQQKWMEEESKKSVSSKKSEQKTDEVNVDPE